jgi:hypothetical protein
MSLVVSGEPFLSGVHRLGLFLVRAGRAEDVIVVDVVDGLKVCGRGRPDGAGVHIAMILDRSF